MKIKQRPIWFSWWPLSINPSMWVTFNKTIYYPKNIQDPYSMPWMIEHESVHVRQQGRDGWFKWFWRYISNKEYRFEYETEAIAAELRACPTQDRQRIFDWYCNALAGSQYHYAAESIEAARNAIQRYLDS